MEAQVLIGVLERQKFRGMFVYFVVPRSETFTLQKPKTLSTKQRRVFQPFDLRGMLEPFKGE